MDPLPAPRPLYALTSYKGCSPTRSRNCPESTSAGPNDVNPLSLVRNRRDEERGQVVGDLERHCGPVRSHPDSLKSATQRRLPPQAAFAQYLAQPQRVWHWLS